MFDFFAINSFFKLKDEVREQNGHCELGNDLDKGLSDADSLSTEEWRETGAVPSFALSSEEVRTLWIKALRNELFRLLPLNWIMEHPTLVDD